MEDCLFCKIVSGTVPATKVFENEHVLAFLDIAPVRPGHTLVVPKEHHVSFSSTPEEVLAEVVAVGQTIVHGLKSSGLGEAANVSFNDGKAAGQVIFHLHFHIIPRTTGDELKLWPQQAYTEGEMERIATTLRAGIEKTGLN